MDQIEMESNFDTDFLSDVHRDFLIGWLEFERLRDAAILDQFLKEKS
jgi:hypothetical protein